MHKDAGSPQTTGETKLVHDLARKLLEVHASSLKPWIDRKSKQHTPSSVLRGSSARNRTHTCRRIVQCGCARVMSMNINTRLFSSLSRGDMTKETSRRRASYGGVAENVCALSASESVVLCLVFCHQHTRPHFRALSVPFVHVLPFDGDRTLPCRLQTVVDGIILVGNLVSAFFAFATKDGSSRAPVMAS